MDAKAVATLLDATPPSYIFKSIGSLAIRIRPGESNDTQWDEEPLIK